MTGDAGETWYVVSDTRAQIVNLVPAVVIGLDKIDRILTLRGNTPRAADKTADIQHSFKSHDCLCAAFEWERRRIQKPPLPFDLIEGDKDDPFVWEQLVLEFFKEQPRVGQIFYVYTGGTRDMMLGTWDGLKRVVQEVHPNANLEYLAKQQLRIFWPKERRSVHLDPSQNKLSLEGYLRLHGFERTGVDASVLAEAVAIKRQQLTMRLAQLVFTGGDAEVDARITFLNRIMETGRAEPRDLAALGGAFDQGVRAIAPELRLRSDGSTLVCEDSESRRYLGGAWFEQYVWHRVRDVVVDPTNVHLGLMLRDCANPTPADHDAEIDVAIHVGDALHVVECKTDNKARKEAQIDKVLRRKLDVSSIYGSGWLCHARPCEPRERDARIAEKLGLELVTGPAAVDLLFGRIRNIVKNGR